MKAGKIGRRPLLLLGLLGASAALAFSEQTLVLIPNMFNPNETDFQGQTHFLAFFAGKPGETAATAKAYYKAVDPNNAKPTFQKWLVNAGFIQNESDWNPSGPQRIACNLPGCDLPAGTYGPGIINTDAHAIVLNAADLGFVRNQFIRCVPSCDAANPTIYTYLENYPVNPFAAKANGRSGFPLKTGFPTPEEATAAINSAVNRPLGDLPGCDNAAMDTVLGCSIQRIADVAFEWAPAANSTSSKKFGQLYAYIFATDGSGISDAVHTQETLSVPPPGFKLADRLVVANGTNTAADIGARALTVIQNGDPFPPNLDFLGFKQHPGVCFICHGGYPQKLTSTGAYPRQGNVDGFKFLPLDIRSLLFTSDTGSEATSRLSQEPHMKVYNLAVLKTVPTQAETDDQGVTRVAHLREVIRGWYAGTPSDPNGNLQNGGFIPRGWREAPNGPAPAGSEELYQTVIAPNCRSCHFTRELSLDFGTAANFDSKRQGLLDLTFRPFCATNNPDKGARPMPLAHLTFQRFWEANVTDQILADGTVMSQTADRLAQHFGFSNVQAYCASVR